MGIQFLYYTGMAEMKAAERNAAIETFRDDPYVKVLVSCHHHPSTLLSYNPDD